MAEFRAASPSSDVFSDEVDTSSLKEKSLLKKSTSKHSNSLRSGYVPVNGQEVNKTGIRGRKTFAFWTLVVLLCILAVGNLILTITILGVLRLGQGMESIEFLPQAAIKFVGETDLGHLYKRDGLLEGFKDEPVHISADNSAVYLNLLNRNSRAANKVTVNKNGTIVRGIESFIVKNKQEDILFSTKEPHFHALRLAKSLDSNIVETNRISSRLDHDLKIESKTRINLKGAEGTRIESSEVVLSVDQEMYLKTINGSIILNGTDGTYIDVTRLPVAMINPTNEIHFQYKLCVCMPQGKLFKIQVFDKSARVYCNHINMTPQNNPCI